MGCLGKKPKRRKEKDLDDLERKKWRKTEG